MIKRLSGVFLLKTGKNQVCKKVSKATTVFLVTVILFAGCEQSGSIESRRSLQKSAQSAQKAEIPRLYYTKHARCRMACRHIDETEVREIISANHINVKKTQVNNRPCPTYAYEGYSHDQQHLRIVIARCAQEWKVVTCIDLDKEQDCTCR